MTGPSVTTQAAHVGAGPTVPSGNPERRPEARAAQGGLAGVWWRRLRLWLVVAVALILAAALIGLYQSRVERGALDPDGVTPDGSRAAATLLRANDVTVEEHHDVGDALGVAEDGDATLLVATPDLLSTASLERLARMPKSVRVVLVEPFDLELKDLDLGIELREQQLAARTEPPGCDFAEAVSAGDAEVGAMLYDAPTDATSCYRGALVVASREGGEVVVLGARDPLTNDRLDERGNAALTLGLLSAHKKLIWLLPSGPEGSAQARSLEPEDLLPPWARWVEIIMLVAAVLAVLWRSRRLGPPVAEPLPVVVRSAETVEGRARLYRRARARSEAYEALRAGALARVLPPLGLGREPDYRAVVEAIAERTGRPMAHIYAALYGPPPADDVALVAAADSLDALVQDILDPARAETAPHRFDGEGRPH
jgi:hypothetical protein